MGIYLNSSKDSLNKGKMSWLIMKDTKNKNINKMMKINNYNGDVKIIKPQLKTQKIKKFSYLLNQKVAMTASH